MNIQPFIKIAQQYLILFVVFAFYLITLPYIVELLIPCLRPLPGIVYEYTHCNILLSLDRFMILALLGLALSAVVSYVRILPRSLKRFMLTGMLLALLLVVSYHANINRFEREIKRAPLYADTIPKAR